VPTKKSPASEQAKGRHSIIKISIVNAALNKINAPTNTMTPIGASSPHRFN
jgi:hypothetical protein